MKCRRKALFHTFVPAMIFSSTGHLWCTADSFKNHLNHVYQNILRILNSFILEM